MKAGSGLRSQQVSKVSPRPKKIRCPIQKPVFFHSLMRRGCSDFGCFILDRYAVRATTSATCAKKRQLEAMHLGLFPNPEHDEPNPLAFSGVCPKMGDPKSWLISYGKWWLTDWHRLTIGFEGDSASLDLVAGWQLLALWQNNTCNSQVAEGQWCVTLDGNYTVLKTDRIATYFDPAIRSFDSSIRDVGSAEGILNLPLFGWKMQGVFLMRIPQRVSGW